MNFSNNQKIQEEQYVLPYHWFLSRDTYRGRVYFSYLDLCFSLISKDKNIKLLDAGCGDAKVLAELNKKKYFNLHGLDYSEKAINFARILLPEVNFISSDLRKINYKSESFDTILLIEVIEHIKPEYLNSVFREIKRILKENGEIIISVPSINLPLNKKHYQHFSVDKLKKIIKNNDLKLDKIIGQGNSLWYKKIIYKFIDNRYYNIKVLSKFYNLKIYPIFEAKSKLKTANRFILRVIK